MLNQFMKWSLLIGIWRKYHRPLKLLPLLLIVIIVVHMLHGDYISYVQVSEQESHIGLSYLIKWGAMIAVVAAYWLYVRAVLATPIKPTGFKTRDKNSTKTGANASNKKSKSGKANKNQDSTRADNTAEATDKPDPFANIRKKDTLRTKAEVILDKSSSDSHPQ